MEASSDWQGLGEIARRSAWYDVATGDFTDLEIRPANVHFSYFWDTTRQTLIKQFLLDEATTVVLLCEIRLVPKGGKFTPRVRLTRANKSVLARVEPVKEEVTAVGVKASVSTDGGHENFVKLMSFVLGLSEVDSSVGAFHMVTTDEDIVRATQGRSREEVVPLVAALLDSRLTEAEISLISDRKAKLEEFRQLLDDPTHFAAERARLGTGREGVWQALFEGATWIFGYGLTLVTHDALGVAKLEAMTTGASLFAGAGKRSDAVLKSRAAIASLLFCEIKHHETDLLKATPYRQPDVYSPSGELVGGVAQLQKTVRKAVRGFNAQIQKLFADDGSPTGIEFATTRPRQVLLAGDLRQFQTENGVNTEKVESFELYRRAHPDIEIVTFDELYARAKFIVEG